MKKITLFIAAAVALSAQSVVSFAQTGDEIITKHIEAIGGEKAWSKVKSMKMTGATSVQGMDVGMEIMIQDQKAMRTNVSLMGMEGYIIITDKGGWMYMPFQPGMDKVTPYPEEQLKAVKGNLSIRNGFLADKSVVKSSKFSGRDTLDGVPCLKVDISGTDENERTVYFDAKNYYMVRVESTVKKGDEEAEVAVSYSNFQKQDGGIVVPMTQTNPMLGGDIVFKKVEVNPAFPEGTFVATEPAKDETKK